jgi:hypothetical protein
MAKFKSKHIVEDIDNVRCTLVESGISMERAEFLKSILEFNNYEVKIEKEAKKEEGDPDTYKLGVTDIVFMATVAVYERKLKNKDGKTISPAYWNQETSEINPYYWMRR